MSDGPHEVPLTECLRSVPKEARIIVDLTPFSSQSHPVGVYCHFSADRMDELERELAEAKDWKSIKVTKDGETHPLGTLLEMIESELTDHKAALEKCEEILDMTIRDQPACDGGSLYYEHYDGEGNYTGSESIDPIGAYGRLLGEITKALSEIAKLKGNQ